MKRKHLVTHDSMPWTQKKKNKQDSAIRVRRSRRNLDAAIRRYDDFDIKQKIAEMKEWFKKTKDSLVEYGNKNPVAKLFVKNMVKAIALSTAALAGSSAQSDIAKLQKINANLKSGYIDMEKIITNNGVEYRQAVAPSKILIGLKMFIAVLSSIVAILIRRSYSAGEQFANFFGGNALGGNAGRAVVSTLSGGKV